MCEGKSEVVYIGFIDFRKAFDSIWHEALFVKLLHMGIGDPYYNIIQNMYNTVTSSVRLLDKLTHSFPIHRGVSQGDILSPLLFNLLLNNIVEEFQHPDCAPPKLINKEVGCLLYADDLAIISTSPMGL